MLSPPAAAAPAIGAGFRPLIQQLGQLGQGHHRFRLPALADLGQGGPGGDAARRQLGDGGDRESQLFAAHHRHPVGDIHGQAVDPLDGTVDDSDDPVDGALAMLPSIPKMLPKMLTTFCQAADQLPAKTLPTKSKRFWMMAWALPAAAWMDCQKAWRNSPRRREALPHHGDEGLDQGVHLAPVPVQQHQGGADGQDDPQGPRQGGAGGFQDGDKLAQLARGLEQGEEGLCLAKGSIPLETWFTAGPTVRRATAKAATVPLCFHKKARKGWAAS